MLEFIQFRCAVILGQSQFLLNDLELFPEEEVTLLFMHAFLDGLPDLLLSASQFPFVVKQDQDLFHPLEQVDRLQDFLELFLVGGR